MMSNITKIISEGRYDSFTRKIVKDIMLFIKKSENEFDDEIMFDLPHDLDGKSTYIHESGVEFEVSLNIYRTNDTISYGDDEKPYHVNTYIDVDGILVVELILDETYGRTNYQQIFYKINEDIRHEIEHYVQAIDRLEKEEGKEEKERRFKDRQQPLRPDTSGYESTFEHHMDPAEVEALVHGFYRRAKLEKKPLDVIMMSDLKTEIKMGNLTEEEGFKLFEVFIKYAKRNLPHAVYSK